MRTTTPRARAALASATPPTSGCLAAIELHDRPYAIWRRVKRSGRPRDEAFDEMLVRIPDPRLFLRFVELDGSTEGKDPEPVRWLTEQLERRGVDIGSPSPP